MPFIVRDPEGNIAGVYNQAVDGGEEVSQERAEGVRRVPAHHERSQPNEQQQ
ncbi:MAG: hypothetical protein HN491_15785 [Rhodospirillales bacterium]|nr:hypothetical protein [Rhodospirillales bacterium]